MHTEPSTLPQIAILLPILVGLATILATLVIHGVVGRGLVLLVLRAMRHNIVGTSFLVDVVVIASAALILFAAHLAEIALWAGVLIGCGEFSGFGLALYHSATNYTTLGYGDIIMSPAWRLMGPIEAMDGMLLVGLSTAVLFAVVQRIARRSIPGILSDDIGN